MRIRHLKSVRFTFVAAVSGLFVACSSEVVQKPDPVGSAQQELLATACTYDTAGNLTLKVLANEVAYVGFQAGCGVEPCVVTNAVDASLNNCKVNSGKGITITATGTGTNAEKVILDYTNGLFGLGATSVTLDSATTNQNSKLVVIAKSSGSNIAVGANGVDLDTRSARVGGAKLDVTLKWSTATSPGSVTFQGGAGADVFTADPAGWAVMPTGWDTAANISKVLGTQYTGAVTANGGAGDDILAGGGGSNLLQGGDGNDVFLQSSTARAETMQGGDGIDAVDYSSRSAALNVTINAAGIVSATVNAGGTNYKVGDKVTVSGGNGQAQFNVSAVNSTTGAITGVTLASAGSGYASGVAVAVTGGSGSGGKLNTTAGGNDGAAGEMDDVKSDVEIVRGGSGADVLDASAVVGTDVVLIGGAGNDTLVGGDGADDLCGGAGNDKLVWSGAASGNGTGDYLVGGAGVDTADYSTASAGVVACLDITAGPGATDCATSGSEQNGIAGEVDVVNDTTKTAVCPRASLTIDLGGTPTVTAVPAGLQGGAMAVDVENLTGHPTLGNTLDCGSAACTLIGGSGNDTLNGSSSADAIFGKGGTDTVKGAGGADLIDVSHTGATGITYTVDCGSAAATILMSIGDTLTSTNCSSASIVK